VLEHNFSWDPGDGNLQYFQSAATTALVVGLVSSVGFLIGYGIWAIGGRPPRKITGTRAESLSTHRLIVMAVIFSALGALFFAVFLITNHIPLGSYIGGRSIGVQAQLKSVTSYEVDLVNVSIPAALVLIAVGQIRRDRTLEWFGWAIAGLVMVRAFGHGDRLVLLPMVGGVFCYHYLKNDRRPRFVTLVSVLLVALFVATVIRETRYVGAGRPGVASRVVDVALHPDELVTELTQNKDSAEADAFAVAATAVPSRIPWKYGGATFGDLLVRPVPRALWANKPLPPKEQVLATVVPREYKNGTANPEFTAVLSFYMDFGVPGVFLGMIVFGMIFRYVWDFYTSNRDTLEAQITLSLFVPFIAMALRDSPTTSLVRGGALFIPVWAMFRFAREPVARAVDRHASPMLAARAELADS
jgi:hypothetical protein